LGLLLKVEHVTGSRQLNYQEKKEPFTSCKLSNRVRLVIQEA